MRFLILIVAAILPVAAQTPSISATAIYQKAVAEGIVYIQPTACTAIINQRAATNWKTLGVQLATNASIGTVIAKATSELNMNNAWTLAATGAFALGEYTLGKLQNSVPEGTAALSPLLNTGATVQPGSEWTVCASQFQGVAGPALLKRLKAARNRAAAPLLTVSTTIQGYLVTYTAQGVQTMILATGSKVKGLIAIDVMIGTTPSASVAEYESPGPLDLGYYDKIVLAKIQRAHRIIAGKPRYPGQKLEEEQ